METQPESAVIATTMNSNVRFINDLYLALGVVGFFSFGGDFVDLFQSAQNQSAETLNVNQLGNATTDQTQAMQNGMTATLPTTPAAGFKIVDTVVGTGAVAKAGSKLVVHYSGYLLDGTKFDSSLDRNKPFEFTLGAGEVISGWEAGFAGMKVGGKRTITIPPEMAYGDVAQKNIPTHSTLVFEVQLLDVK